jgi:hypothetical protein
VTEPTSPPPLPIAAAGLIATSIVVGIALALVAADAGGVTFFVAFAGTGGYLVVQRPRNSVGWFLVLAGWGLLLGTVQVTISPETLRSGALTPTEAVMAWSNGCGWSLALMGFLGIALVFPTGSLPDGRGWWPSRITLGASVVLTALVAFGPLINVMPRSTGLAEDVPNPMTFAPDAAFWDLVPPPTVLFTLLGVLVLAGIVALVIRARRAVGMERLQFRWLIAAITGTILASIAWAIQTVIVRTDTRGPVDLLILVSYVAVPLSILIAIMRYRLYDIDRIISRTIAYGAVLLVLAAVFGGGILLLSSLLASSFAQAESIAVAASTLLTYAVLQPVAQRIRRDVDRRFDRTRYDAERTVQAFAVRLRHETDVEAVTRDLATTTQAVVSPTATSLWLRPSR